MPTARPWSPRDSCAARSAQLKSWRNALWRFTVRTVSKRTRNRLREGGDCAENPALGQ